MSRDLRGIISHAAVPRLFAAFPDLMCTASPEANRRLILKSMGKQQYRRGQTFLPLPSSPLSGLKTPLFSMRDKLGILLEPFRARGQRRTSRSQSWSCADSGRASSTTLSNPFIGGIYAGDPHRLVTRYALPSSTPLRSSMGASSVGLSPRHERQRMQRLRV